jgi:cysteine desulfurase family protein (TIGR01976 family)
MNIEKIRAEFPALARRADERVTIFFDNAAGTQVARHCIDRVNDYFINNNANSGGVFATSRRSDAMIAECRSAVADFIGADDADEVAFGANMTTLTQFFARAFGRDIQPGDEIVTTRLEHEANVSPWLALAERGAIVRFADINPDDATINLDSLAEQLNDRTRLVAVGYASNGFGTINPVAQIAKMAHDVGALCFVDAVHYSPHGVIDVGALGCDLLVYSAYKSFGPHIGIIWGRRAVMERVKAYHLRTVSAIIPDKYEVGTQNHEGIAGALGALEYLASLAPDNGAGSGAGSGDRATRLRAAMTMIKEYEQSLSLALIDMFEQSPRVRVYGITDRSRFDLRVPTFAITVEGYTPRQVAEHLAQASINVWSGNYYALEPMTRLGLQEHGGAVRISLAHYNTKAEIAELAAALAKLAG